MKGGVTRKVEETIKALDAGQLKRALTLTDREELAPQRAYVEEAAKTCLANKGKPKVCEAAIKKARSQVKETVTLPEDDTGLEGLESYMGTRAETPAEAETPDADAAYEDCEECHVADAVVKVATVCQEMSAESGGGCSIIAQHLDDPDTQPEEWIRSLRQARDQAQGSAKELMGATLGELREYLTRRQSPYLEALDKP